MIVKTNDAVGPPANPVNNAVPSYNNKGIRIAKVDKPPIIKAIMNPVKDRYLALGPESKLGYREPVPSPTWLCIIMLKKAKTKVAKNWPAATGAKNWMSDAIAKIPTPERIHGRKSFPMTSSSAEIGSM